MTIDLSRRETLAGALLLAFALPLRAEATPSATASLTAYLRITPDGRVTVLSPTTEMGQGTHTAHAALIAEELGVALSSVTVETPHPSEPFRRGGSMGSGGSWGVRAWHDKLRLVGAQARAMLLQAAATRTGLPIAGLDIRDGQVVQGTRLLGSIGQFVSAASRLTPPEAPAMRPAAQRTLTGRDLPRVDIPAKVRGAHVYAMDISRPGKLYACARLSPVYRGELESFDKASAMAVPDVLDVVALPGGAAVVARNSWAAMQGAEALAIRFKPTAHDNLSSEEISAGMRAALGSATAASAKEIGDMTATLSGAARVIEADYEVPYLAHSPMEPWNCVVEFSGDRLDVWAPTQTQDRLLNDVSAVSGVPAEKTTIHTTLLGGGYGRRLRDTEGVQAAVLVAKAVGKPVHFFWRREDEIGQGWYRPAQAARLKAAISRDGKLSGLWVRTAGPSLGRDFPARPTLKDGDLDGASVQGLADIRYRLPAYRVDYVMKHYPVPTAPWRAVGATHNAYFVECFLDEVASALGQDPYQLRRSLLAHDPRALKVIDLAADVSGWNLPLAAGHARGMAYFESYGSLCANVVELSVENGAPRIHKATCVLDCGTVVSPDGARAQAEGGIIMGVSTALNEAVMIANGQAQTRNYDTYQLLRHTDGAFPTEVRFINSGETIGGVGEPVLPPTAPALVNALFALKKKPMRTLPIRMALQEA